MRRVAIAALVALAALAVSATGASAPPSPWDGVNPFACELQQAGFGSTVAHPGADPFCIEFDKRHQSVADLGVVDFLAHEPARVALASDKCFYFQSDHWRGSIVQDDGSTKTYEWDGHYFFNKATGDGGVWVTNFSLNGRTYDPSTIPGMPADYARHFGPGTGGMITHDEFPADPSCVQKAAQAPPYVPPPAAGRSPRCGAPSGDVGPEHLGPVRLGMPESRVWALLGTPERVQRGFLRFCLDGGGKELVGLPGDRSGTDGSPGDDPVLFLLTTNAKLATKRGVARGSAARAVARAYPHAREWFVQGHTHVQRAAAGLLVGVNAGRVRFLAAYDTKRIHGAGAVRGWLRRSQ
jgi:hypothetical protein